MWCCVHLRCEHFVAMPEWLPCLPVRLAVPEALLSLASFFKQRSLDSCVFVLVCACVCQVAPLDPPLSLAIIQPMSRDKERCQQQSLRASARLNYSQSLQSRQQSLT